MTRTTDPYPITALRRVAAPLGVREGPAQRALRGRACVVFFACDRGPGWDMPDGGLRPRCHRVSVASPVRVLFAFVVVADRPAHADQLVDEVVELVTIQQVAVVPDAQLRNATSALVLHERDADRRDWLGLGHLRPPDDPPEVQRPCIETRLRS